jgi:DNA replication protein DnaC
MDELTLLKPKLSRLKLSGMLDSITPRLSQAMTEKWDFTALLDILLQDEIDRRDGKQLSRRLAKSGLEPDKTFATFDFSFNPRIHEPTVRELGRCDYIEGHENIFLVGPSGTGKTHLAHALGHEACRRGLEVQFHRTARLFHWIAAGDVDGSRQRRLKSVLQAQLLILDDFGLQPLSDDEQADLYEIVCERYEHASTILTSNRDFAEWPMVFSNPLMASAAMDRLVHHGIKLVIEGKSYRLDSFAIKQKSLTADSLSS